MAQNPNQLAQGPLKGTLDLRMNNTVMSAKIDSTSGGGLVPGQAVKMVDSVGGVPKVVEVAAITDDVYGFIVCDQQSQTFAAGDMVEILAMRNGVMYMEASAAIARNAQVMLVISGQKVVTAATTGNRIVGRAMDKGVTAGDLIRVTVDLPGATVP